MVQWTTYIKRRSLVLFLIFVSIGLSESVAQEEEFEKNQAHLQTIQQQLQEKQAAHRNIVSKEQNLMTELYDLERLLEENQRQLRKYQEDLTKNEDEFKTIRRNLEQLQNSYNKKKTTLAKRLRAIYKMGDLGYLNPLFAISSYTDIQQQIKYLQIISESDLELINTVEKDMQTIHDQKKMVQQHKQKIEQDQKEIKKQQAQITTQQQQKEQLLPQIQKDKKLLAEAMRRLEASARRLDKLLLSEPEKTPQKTKPEERAPTITFPKNPQKVVQAYNDRYFRANKGELLWPVEGKIITPYGRINIGGTTTLYKGVDIQAQKGTPFYSVFKGTVRYADWFEGRGNLIILDHGGNYYTIYAHADELIVKPGEVVDTRQILGKVGDTDSIKGSHLYFEVRANGKPEDPRRWLAKVR